MAPHHASPRGAGTVDGGLWERDVPSTMFPPEFLTTMEDQSTEVLTGGEPQPQDKPSPNPPAQPQQEMQNLLDSESFQDILDNVLPANELADATSLWL